jgi:hypothetical protein
MNDLLKTCFLVIIPALALSTLRAQNNDGQSIPLHHVDGGFRNTDPDFEEPAFTKMAPWVIGRLINFSSKPIADMPRTYNDGSALKQDKPYTVTWVGHSTCLIQFEGATSLPIRCGVIK